ncbi:RND family efflux transporter, MFP subunit [Sphingopyxis sp. YR583]|uniref:efflux RND transporter periplasmic adaptor subunit n=1 Tax=Sphingopyxis sp. YR583 TaxID=1881047 RepID=UPI0008A7844A|nr:efflux RND transporter periplasmic adaptor subunit [Sphingopyxis sp. YR583]SEH17173.1 RND family efflux transporter, MFP subunit [Sphingopyxis sp. YR583]
MTEDRDYQAPATSGKRRNYYIAGAAILLVGVFAVSQSGAFDRKVQWSDDGRVAKAPAAQAAAAPAAVAKVAEPVGEVRGIVKAKNEAVIASRITARITSMPYGEGKSFGKGALLASFDCSQTKAQLNAANAAAAAYRKTYETNAELDQYEAVGKNEVAVSQANMNKAVAEAAAVSAQLTDCAVYAPFAGTVVEEIAHAREVAASGQPLLKIQSGGNLEIELIVPSRWLTWLKPGAAFRFKIDETGQEAAGVVTRFGASVDAVSKTIRVTADITEQSGLVLPGMSGSALFPQAENAAATAPLKAPVADAKSS